MEIQPKIKKWNLFYSDLINENEVYSLRQLEAFNALSPSEQLKLGTKAAERSAESTFIPKQETFEPNNIKLEVVEEYPLNKPEPTLNSNNTVKATDLLILPENPIRRVLIANQLTGAVAKANPKAVTASVFKTIPIEAKPLKQINGNEQLCNGNGGVARAPQTVTTSLIQPIVAVKRDSFGKIQSTIAKPSLVPRQTVVTASLFQPRNTATGLNISPKFPPSTTVNQQASRAAETMNKSFCMLSDDLSQPTCEYSIPFTVDYPPLSPRQESTLRTLTASIMHRTPTLLSVGIIPQMFVGYYSDFSSFIVHRFWFIVHRRSFDTDIFLSID